MPSTPSANANKKSASRVKAESNTKPKPKRPLSGYNLFYRYKRNKILEATAGPGKNLEEKATNALIHSVLIALPGLEGVPPVHAIWTFPPNAINELRASNIRVAMQGKLFPNENARNRLHRKVHGMGFVEMGKTMREMWGGMDAFTKEVFCELADVGRIRYRNLLAKYKMGSQDQAPQAKTKSQPVDNPKDKNDPALLATANAPAKIEDTPKPTGKPSILSHLMSHCPQAQVTAAIAYPVVSSSSSIMEPLSIQSIIESPPITTSHIVSTAPPNTPGVRKYERRVSIINDAAMPSSLMMSNHPAVFSLNKQQVAQEINNEFREFKQNIFQNSQRNTIMQNFVLQNCMPELPIPPPPLFCQQAVNRVTSNEGTANEVVELSSSTLPANNFHSISCSPCASGDIICSSPMLERKPEEPKKAQVSAQDFMEFIGRLGDAIDQQDGPHNGDARDNVISIQKGAIGHQDGEKMDPSLIFGKPLHDNSAIPMPAAYELNNNRARMA
mmetsp:Transcript_26992/g.46027  ORF Transcript_26992/g.46027 Transcript_26992/m.46027 type:complete len:500 (+) Transcript_26992:158-1657(+)|eukprot:CAMPEP_0183729388 /NCGR_PEP_ID=MMETSP0737-20130205/30110_1 /TAXON_ID=385413 /ORGANISM="Thalassiosira miniscula, Strain CCMP1093" /LENGTH=499 /DNA_ID=CAMNT_0025961549 /DNA_START=124 /DNA_END=1623 /DNA_ORIENTATION=-